MLFYGVIKLFSAARRQIPLHITTIPQKIDAHHRG